MSCGFGAVILLFLIVDHSVSFGDPDSRETERLKSDIASSTQELSSTNELITDLGATSAASADMLSSLQRELELKQSMLARLEGTALEKAEKLAAAKQTASAAEDRLDEQQDASRVAAEGEAKQKFLTGINVTGKRIVIMVDRSASMLDEKIINVLRRRARGGASAALAPKWIRTKKIASWLVNKLPPDSMVKIISFSEAAIVYPEDRWVSASDTAAVSSALFSATKETPNGGTSLYNAFFAARSLSPRADSVYLITDGLPTLGKKAPRSQQITGKQRYTLFQEAYSLVASRMRVNTILLPIEGDPMAAYAYWILAKDSGGRMLSPSRNWP